MLLANHGMQDEKAPECDSWRESWGKGRAGEAPQQDKSSWSEERALISAASQMYWLIQ